MSLKNYRLFNVKRIVALMLVIVFSFQSMVTYAAVPISNGKGAILLNDDLDNIVYLYESDGETYKAVESISDDFSQVSTKIYKEVNGEYELEESFVTYITNLGEGRYEVKKVSPSGITRDIVELAPTAEEAYISGIMTRGAWEYVDTNTGSTHFEVFTAGAVTALLLNVVTAGMGTAASAIVSGLVGLIVSEEIPILYYERTVHYYREDDGMVTQVKVVTDFYYDSDRTAYCDTTTVIYEGKFPW